ncbi:MAG: hypothetical protein R2710_16410 [Acidimicrobiales bacterium]
MPSRTNAAGLDPFAHLLIVAVVMAGVLSVVTQNLLPTDEEGHADAEPAPATPSTTPRRAPVVLLVVAGMFAVVAEVTGGDWATFRMTDDGFGAAAGWQPAFVATPSA